MWRMIRRQTHRETPTEQMLRAAEENDVKLMFRGILRGILPFLVALVILFWILGLGPRSMSRFIGDTYLSQAHPQTTFRCVENRYDATLEVYTLRYQTGEKELTLHVQGKWFPNKVVFDSWAKEASEDNEETNK